MLSNSDLKHTWCAHALNYLEVRQTYFELTSSYRTQTSSTRGAHTRSTTSRCARLTLNLHNPDEFTATHERLMGHTPSGQVAHCTRDDLLRIMYDHPEDGKRVRMHTLRVALRRFIVRR